MTASTNPKTKTTGKTDSGGSTTNTNPTPTKKVAKKATAKTTDIQQVNGLTDREQEISLSVLADLIPDSTIADEYVHRAIEGYEDFEILDLARDHKWNVLLNGPTGTGKSHFFRAYGATHGIPVATVSCHGAADPALWFGGYRPLPNESGGTDWIWVDGIVTTILRHGGVLFFDELNFCPEDITASLHQILRERELILLEKGNEVVRAHEDVLICAAYNPGYGGTRELNEALSNRFAIKVDWDYDGDVEEALFVPEPLLEFAKQLRACREIDTPIPTNALVELDLLAQATDEAFAKRNFLQRFRVDERAKVEELWTLRAANIDGWNAVDADDDESDEDTF